MKESLCTSLGPLHNTPLVGLGEQRQQVMDLLERTLKHGESNSLLLVGPRCSGKRTVGLFVCSLCLFGYLFMFVCLCLVLFPFVSLCFYLDFVSLVTHARTLTFFISHPHSVASE